MRMHSERGVALFLALILISTLSVLTVSLMFLAQSESFASSNYRLMTQARYGAEAGVQKAADFILNSDNNANKYDINTSNVLIPSTVSPVKFGIDDVVLSSDPTVTSHYPDAATIAAFQAATTGQLVAGNSTVTYTTTAKLLGIDSFADAYRGGITRIVQTWEITSNATIAGTRKSTVQVSAIIDAPKFPAISYGAFAADPGCGALTLKGSVSTDSYSSNQLGAGAPVITNSGGDVGSNGNIDFNGGGIDVNGNLSTPRQGVGACTANAVTACTGSSVCNTTSLQQLPQAVALPTPQIPTPSTTALQSITTPNANPATGTCHDLGLIAGTNCTVIMGATGADPDSIVVWNTSITPLKLPELDLKGKTQLILLAPPNNTITNTFDINSIKLSGQATLGMDTNSAGSGVVVNIVGKDSSGVDVPYPIDFVGNTGGGKASDGTYAGITGGFMSVPGALAPPVLAYAGKTSCGASCSQYEASLMQLVYGGAQEIYMKGNSDAAATIYAPNAVGVFEGSVAFYGSIIAKKLTLQGNFKLHYDTSLSGAGMTAGPPMISSFSWKKY